MTLSGTKKQVEHEQETYFDMSGEPPKEDDMGTPGSFMLDFETCGKCGARYTKGYDASRGGYVPAHECGVTPDREAAAKEYVKGALTEADRANAAARGEPKPGLAGPPESRITQEHAPPRDRISHPNTVTLEIPSEEYEVEAVGLVIAERRAQSGEHGQRDFTMGTWLNLLSEELGEAAKALNSGESMTKVMEELQDTGALCIAAIASAWRQATTGVQADGTIGMEPRERPYETPDGFHVGECACGECVALAAEKYGSEGSNSDAEAAV